MLNEIRLLAFLMGALSILYWGLGTISTSFYSLSSDFLGRFVANPSRKGMKAFISGFCSSIMFQNNDHLHRVLSTYISIRAVDSIFGTLVFLGTLFGLVILTLFLSIDLHFFPQIMLGAGMFLSYWHSSGNYKNIYQIVMGYGIIFWSIQLLFKIVLPIGSNLEFFSVIQNDYNILFIFFYSILGIIITVLFKRPILVIIIAIVLGKTGFLNTAAGISLLIGVNVGAALGSLIHFWGGASRVQILAYIHLFFNVCVGVIFLFFLRDVVFLVDQIIPIKNPISDFYGKFGLKIVIGYFLFNLVVSLFTLVFLRPVTMIIRKKILVLGEENRNHLFLDINAELLPSCSLMQIYKDLLTFAGSTDSMFSECRKYVFDDNKLLYKSLNLIKKTEKDADIIQSHLTVQICKIMEKKLTAGQSFEAQGFVKIADELESITDYLEKVAICKTRLVNDGFKFDIVRKDFIEYYDRVYDYYKLVVYCFSHKMFMDLSKYNSISEELKVLSQEIREKYLDNFSKQSEISPLTVLTYSDMVVSLRKIRGHIYNISQTLCRMTISS